MILAIRVLLVVFIWMTIRHSEQLNYDVYLLG